MRNGNLKFLAVCAVVLCGLLLLYRLLAPRSFQERFGVMPALPTVTIDGHEWREVMSWDFVDGEYPAGWGWGTYEVNDGVLEIGDATGQYSVYFLPASHGGDFILETEVSIGPAAPGKEAEAHLISRDSNRLIHECGVGIFGGTEKVILRNTVDGTYYLHEYADIGTPIAYGSWDTLRLENLSGRLTVYLNGEAVVVRDEHYPRGLYNEPHLTTNNGIAKFRSVRLYDRGGEMASPREVSSRSAVGATGATGGRSGAEQTDDHGLVIVLKVIFYFTIFWISVYFARHYRFTVNRLYGLQRHPYLDIATADWPDVTVLIPAHNEEAVIADILQAMVEVDYPPERLCVLAIDDRSSDKTGEIIADFARRYPRRIIPYERCEGRPGKAAVLHDTMDLVGDEIVLVFDADYIPGRGLVKQLVAPFFDPEVGASMGRVVPINVEQNLLTRVLDLERAGGYQVDQQARMNLRLVPQYGGTVGGVRVPALESTGGWRTDSLAEDTDATFRLLLKGWKTAYQNRSECYEQVPATWAVRRRQILRWAQGHNQSFARFFFPLLVNHRTRFAERFDGALLLSIYVMSLILLLGWGAGIILWYLGISKPGLIIILAVTSYSTLGNFAVFFEVAMATHLDGSKARVRLLPFILLGYLVSLMSISYATLKQIFFRPRNGEVDWQKTERNRRQRA